MKTKIITAIFLLLSVYLLNAQDNNPYGFECSIPGDPPNPAASTLIGGYYKPECISCYTSNTDAYFPVLIVYVQFTDDPGADVGHWHPNEAPAYFGSVIATSKATGYGDEWWNAYNENTKTLSDYWMEVSRGKLHLVGQEVSVVLPHTVDWFEENTNGKASAMESLFVALKNNPNIDWPTFDLWKKDGSTFVYGERDGFVDMMYIVARSNPCSIHSYDGYFRPYGVYDECTHGDEHEVYNQGGISVKIKRSFSEIGSAFQISPGGCENGVMYAPLEKWAMISFTGHEHGHYFFGYGNHFEYHQQYSKVNNYHGMEEYLSPYELLRLGYHEPQVFDFSEPDITIYDWTSFNTNENSEMLKVPIGDEERNEFFIIANRQGASNYDRIMWGDTAHGNPYRSVNPEYNKGVYIYHAYPGETGEGYPWGILIDQECADGLFNWAQDGNRYPDWSCSQEIYYVYRGLPVYDSNDNGGEINQTLIRHDGKSIYTWFSLGEKEYPLCQYGDGTDRIYTNDLDAWTSREWQGDRYDAWESGYNEVFSPYSSPSTADWDNNSSGIFIYLQAQDGLASSFMIYKVGEGGYDEDEILEATPPSKPILFKPVQLYGCNGTYGLPRITWENSKEPDMLRTGDFKRYKIYRAESSSLSTIPVTYSYVATYDDYTPNDTVNYIDDFVHIYCGLGQSQDDRYFRYKVQAVDKYDDLSVLSDFVSTAGAEQREGGDNFLVNNQKPVKFSLSQNYPNPFNPVTQINYSIPSNEFVSIKIYNVAGELVVTLVNYEFKTKGYYSAIFDGTNVASGVYFYSITAGSYSDTKKMVLVK
jgi:hypothetical protein